MSKLTTEAYVQGVLAGERVLLARAITLVESNAPHHFAQAQEVLQQLLPHTGQSIRVGITGVPGAGKSTLIETLGLKLTRLGHKVAVLAVDPTSAISRGSILGDKTRMEQLTREEKAFVRPSPTGGMLGGVARKTRESILVCEAAGYDVILVETVGTGQSEITVRSMVDFFLLLLVPGAGDELQGIKKGVVEIADAILINKADGENTVRAEAARAESASLRVIAPLIRARSRSSVSSRLSEARPRALSALRPTSSRSIKASWRVAAALSAASARVSASDCWMRASSTPFWLASARVVVTAASPKRRPRRRSGCRAGRTGTRTKDLPRQSDLVKPARSCWISSARKLLKSSKLPMRF